MRVLVISHTVFCQTSNMGRTLLSYFSDFKTDEMAQFFIHSEVPTNNAVCNNYYRYTDIEAIKSIFSLSKYGKIFREKDIRGDLSNSRTDEGIIGTMYQRGRRRTAATYLFRNAYWRMAHWYTKEFKEWVKEFNPDVIFLASGDYSFIYRIAFRIAEDLKKPLVVSCVDDYYLYNKNSYNLLGRLQHAGFMKVVNKTMERAECILTICNAMSREYEKLFHKKCYTIYTAADNKQLRYSDTAKKISYIGNLGYKRYLQLLDIGKVIKENTFSEEITAIDVYSAERNPEVIKELTIDNGIRFHGAVSAQEVTEIMEQSIAVLHTESFDEKIKKQVRFSVSTKIAESLMYGPCLIAYGPQGIASIDYLQANEAAYVISSKEDLVSGLEEILSNEEMRKKITCNARNLAEKNHKTENISGKLREWLENVVSHE